MSLETFYLVIAPGLEALARRELDDKFPGLHAQVEKGGIEVHAPFELGLTLHFYLKIPTEIRWRVASFRCRDLPKLYQKISNIRWGRYLLGGLFRLSVASSQSRLLNEKKIAATVTEGIERHFQKQPPKKIVNAEPAEVHIRFHDDECTVSVDLAGSPLFQRGYKTQKAIAPIRENIAAALFWSLHLEVGPITCLLDPMCGTGSLLLEAQRFWQKSPRAFLFQKNPNWRPSDVVVTGPAPTQFLAIDKDEGALSALRETLGHGATGWSLHKCDFFKEKLPSVQGESLAIMCNPPYGERLKLPLPPKEFYTKLFDRVVQLQPRGIGLILPKKHVNLLPERNLGYQKVQEIEFKNGGLPVVYGIWKP